MHNFSELTNQYYDSRTLRKVCGLLGTIKLISGKYLVVATHREFVGVVNNQVIWRLAGHDLIPFIPSLIHLSETQVGFSFINHHPSHIYSVFIMFLFCCFRFLFLQKTQNEVYHSMVTHTLNTPFFYFSYTYDLSHTLQRLSAVGSDFYEVYNNVNDVSIG